MKNLISLIILVFMAISLYAGGSGETSTSLEETTVNAFVSILPQQYFLERIGGQRVNISVMVPPGKSPATYAPTPRQVTDLGSADVFFTIGVAFEKAFIPAVRSNIEDLLIVDTSEGIEKRMIQGHSHEEDDDEHDHENEEPDPHTWMSPVLVIHQATVITETLIALDPEGKEFYRNNLSEFTADLRTLDNLLAESLRPVKGKTMFVYHPAFGYFADRYGLIQEAIETGGKEPSPAQLEEIIEHAQKEGVKVIFVQPEFSADSAAAVAEAIGGAVVPVAPLSPDYINNLTALAEAISESMK